MSVSNHDSDDDVLETGREVIDSYAWSSVHYIDPDDRENRYFAGEPWYRISGQEVSAEVFERRAKEMKEKKHERS